MTENTPYIIWDWNGTLLDDTQAALDTLNTMLSARGGKKITMEFYRDNFSFPVKPFYKSIGVCLEQEDWDALAVEYHDLYAMQPKSLNSQTIKTLQMAATAASGQSILSALRQDLLDEATSEYAVAPFMDFVFGVDNLDGESKLSRGRQLLKLLSDEGHSNFVLIGDSLHDFEVADALGIGCVLCAQGSHALWRLRQVAPTGKTLPEALTLAISQKGEAQKVV